jgi:hypothetical protein
MGKRKGGNRTLPQAHGSPIVDGMKRNICSFCLGLTTRWQGSPWDGELFSAAACLRLQSAEEDI